MLLLLLERVVVVVLVVVRVGRQRLLRVPDEILWILRKLCLRIGTLLYML